MQTRESPADEVESLATGAGVLGTGGGTHPYVELLNVRKLYGQGKPARLVDPNDLADDANVAVVGLMGAPLVTKERLPDPAHICKAVRKADIRDNRLINSRAASQLWTERIGRKACTELGSIVATCSAPRSGREVKDHALLGSVSKAIRLGRAVRDAQQAHQSPIRAVLDAERGVHLFTGKVADVARRTTEGFVRGEALIDGLDDFAGSRFSVDFQNEFTIGWIDGKLTVTVPDLICILDSLSGEALGTETIRYGQRVDVLSLPAADIMKSEEGLVWVGPRGFGYDLDYVSVHG